MASPEKAGYGTGARAWSAEPDYDAPWHVRRSVLPAGAHCVTCRFWGRHVGGLCGVSLLYFDEREVMPPWARCESWRGRE